MGRPASVASCDLVEALPNQIVERIPRPAVEVQVAAERIRYIASGRVEQGDAVRELRCQVQQGGVVRA